MTRSFPLNKKRSASKGVLPIMCFNCLKRVGVLRIDVVPLCRGSICVIREVSVCIRIYSVALYRRIYLLGASRLHGAKSGFTVSGSLAGNAQRSGRIGDQTFAVDFLAAV